VTAIRFPAALRSSLGLVLLMTLLFGFLAAFAPQAAAQDDSGLVISGTARDANREPVPGIGYSVSLDGEQIGDAVSDEEGKWEIGLPGPGIYVVAIDVDSLPEGLSLRDQTVTEREVEVSNRSKSALFALDGVADGSEAVALGSNAGDGTFARYLNRFVSGIRVGALVALAAVGLSLIYGVTGLVNFAHSEMVAFGAVATWWIEDATGLPLVIAAVFGVMVGGLLGFVLEKGLFAPLRDRGLSLISLMVVSIGLAFLMRYMYLIYFGAERKFFSDFRIQTEFKVGPISLPPKDYFIIIISFTVLTIVGLLLQRTRLGTAMRAVADNRDLAESSGIDVRRTILAVWVAGSALAALGGTFIGITQQVSWQMGERQLLLIFAAVTLGGLGTAYGAMVGGIAIGVASEMSTLWLDNDLKFLVALTVLIIILIVRPQGILGQRERFG
jgi:neutral amino acid transport system permease protein